MVMSVRQQKIQAKQTDRQTLQATMSVCLFVMRAGCAKTAKVIDVLLGVVTPRDPRDVPIQTVSGRGFDAAFARLNWLPFVTIHNYQLLRRIKIQRTQTSFVVRTEVVCKSTVICLQA